MITCEFESLHLDATPEVVHRGGKQVLVTPCPTPAACAGEGVDWWHVFGAPVKGDPLEVTTEDEGEMWMHVIAGPGPGTSPRGETPMLMASNSDLALPWIRSFTHSPTDEDLEALQPEAYREEVE